MTAYDAYGAYDDDRPLSGTQVALVDLLDRLLSGGVVLTGDLVLSVADIDLVRISLRAVVVAIREQMEEQWAPILPERTPTGPDRTPTGPDRTPTGPHQTPTGYGGYGDDPG
ncbi:gas vesicle protein [Streptomyces curacoi]|uniref:gas vesicle protein n=1 Tax=Streptomyces curacoi TaxID=146536 RepID=UPI00099E293A|nr:gas vesicle protein [Streptomyces curacoi]